MKKNPTGWQRKAQLLFKSEKLLGAEEIFSYFSQFSMAQMKEAPITSQLQIFDSIVPSPTPPDEENTLTPKRLKDLHSHFARLQQEFLGQRLICLYHAVLIVLLRRGFQTLQTFTAFETLWQLESGYLLNHLSLRWLVSSADTFVDFSPNPTRQALFLNVPTLVNTLKVYETQRDLLTDNTLPLSEKIQAQQQQHLALYDGLRYFRVGTDDTLKNMRARYEKFAAIDPFATQFLLAVFDRSQQQPSAFAMLKSLHTDKKSQWW